MPEEGIARLNERHYIGDASVEEADSQPPPRNPFSLTLRRRREFRLGNRGDRLEYYARVKRFEKRIEELKKRDSAIQKERKSLSTTLAVFTRTIFNYRSGSSWSNGEHVRCRDLIDKREKVVKDTKRIGEVFQLALKHRGYAETLRDLTEAEARRTDDELWAATNAARASTQEIKMKMQSKDSVKKVMLETRQELSKVSAEHAENEIALRRLQWRTRGFLVRTPYAPIVNAKVQHYR